MDRHRELANHLRAFAQGAKTVSIRQGIVKSVSGDTCEVETDGIIIPDVRLRASLAEVDGAMLVTPAVGSAVIVGALSDDLAELAVLAVDKIESIVIRQAKSIVINGGTLGGLVNIEQLTDKLNELVRLVNSHTHVSGSKGTPTTPPAQQASSFTASDYEDSKIKH